MARINDFVAALNDGGARANQFKVVFKSPPPGVALGQEIEFLCKATSIPALTIGEIPVLYRGRQIFVSGDRTYDPWEITILSDRSQAIRGAFEKWQDHLGGIGGYTNRTSIGESPSTYYADAEVVQMDRNNQELRTYKLYDVWPTTVAAVELSFDTSDAIIEFGVTLRFNWMTIHGAPTGQIGMSGA